MELNLTGRVAVVTGASKGIGLAIAAGLAAEGARVVAGARTVTAELARLRDAGGCTVVPTDLSTEPGVRHLLDTALETHGGVDILVNNVGASRPSPTFAGTGDADWQWVFDITLFSAVRAIRAAIPSMTERGGGAIVNIGSINGRLPQPMVVHYSAAKAALTAMGKALSIELAPSRIRVNTISPGLVRTPFWTAPDGFAGIVAAGLGTTAEQVMDQLPGQLETLIGRFSEPAEIASLALYLASDVAASVTGSDFVIDGGTIRTV